MITARRYASGNRFLRSRRRYCRRPRAESRKDFLSLAYERDREDSIKEGYTGCLRLTAFPPPPPPPSFERWLSGAGAIERLKFAYIYVNGTRFR